MDQETDAMKIHIDNERARLTGNLREIESRFRNATDIRQRFNENPLLGLGLAAAGGFLLAMVIGDRRPEGRVVSGEWQTGTRSIAKSPSMSKVSATVDNIFDAFLGLATAKVESFISDAVPGFREQYKKVEDSRSA